MTPYLVHYPENSTEVEFCTGYHDRFTSRLSYLTVKRAIFNVSIPLKVEHGVEFFSCRIFVASKKNSTIPQTTTPAQKMRHPTRQGIQRATEKSITMSFHTKWQQQFTRKSKKNLLQRNCHQMHQQQQLTPTQTIQHSKVQEPFKHQQYHHNNKDHKMTTPPPLPLLFDSPSPAPAGKRKTVEWT